MKAKIFRDLLLALVLLSVSLHAEEGMFPISEIGKIDLRARGLAIDPAVIYNPLGISLIDAVVQMDGGTGSLVSQDGLIITNHHIAFNAIQSASSKENDILTNGFLAKSRGQEIPAKNYSVRITESYRDVSATIRAVLKPGMDMAARAKKLESRIKEIILRTEQNNPGKRAEVAEMIPGKTYILFIYTYLKDVRLVYAPPRGIGDFGGESDNWSWPRHTGDFSFLRAYVGQDGKPAEYAESNVPFRPRRFLKVSPAGVKEGDFIFLLGYPGRTFRHMTSHYLAFEEKFRMPAVAALYDCQIEQMEKMSSDDPSVAIKLSARIKGLANTTKNYRSKLLGLKRTNLCERRRMEEELLAQAIAADPRLSEKWGSLFAESAGIYREMEPWLEFETILDNLPRMVPMLHLAQIIVEAASELEKKENDRESPYMSRNFSKTREALKLEWKNFHEPLDKLFLRQMLLRASLLPEGKRIPAIQNIVSGQKTEPAIAAFVDRLFTDTQLRSEAYLMAWLEKKRSEVEKNPDPLIAFARELQPAYTQLREMRRTRKAKLDLLYSRLIDAKSLTAGVRFIPDANSTLRLTSGRIKGYSPRNGVYHLPITTQKGILEKTTGSWPYNPPTRECELFRAGDFAPWAMPGSGDLPIDILYNADTTGGNSGSPVFDRNGELVGINFDRTAEATINDYTWSPDFSRSIAVDIRYVLWVLARFAGAEHLLAEMGVSR